MREVYGRGEFQRRLELGDLKEVVLKARHPSPPRAGEPFCTQSQIIGLMDREGLRVALLHRYLRPDGSLGASGQADPKRVLYEGVLYFG